MAATSQSIVQASVSANGGAVVSQSVSLVSYSPPSAENVRTSQSVAQLAFVEEGIPACSQAAVLIAYRTGPVENLTSRAWEFTLDGHTFYVITLGEQGTFVYDETTGEWAKWQTQGLPGWNMELGTTWKGKIIAADQSQPLIYELDPTSFLDDGYKTQIRKATGAIPLRGRTFLANYAFRITASLGQPDTAPTLPATAPTINLSYSDDQGKTFEDAGDVIITELEFTQDVQWLSLGMMQAPMRVFQITDTGAIARLDGADAEIEGLD